MKKYTQSLKTILLAIILSFGISFVYAWTGPTTTPPAGNTTAPINTSTGSQYKNGALGVGGLIHGYSNAIFDGSVGIGTATPSAGIEMGSGKNIRFNRPSGVEWNGSNEQIYSSDGSNGVTTGSILVKTGNANRLTIDASSGNVGIGVTTPGAKLDLNGKIRFRSDFTKYDSYGPYSNWPPGKIVGDGSSWGCTCRNSVNKYLDTNTCNFNSFMSGGNNTASCVYTATITNPTYITKIIECGVDFSGAFQCAIIQ